MANSNFITEVFRVVSKIPKGKVATYGQIAIALGRQTRFGTNYCFLTPDVKGDYTPGVFLALAVGNALHQNKDPKVPCHRVVNRTGRLAPNFAFDGWEEQKRRLLTEGVKFRDNMHVDLEQCLCNLIFNFKFTIFNQFLKFKHLIFISNFKFRIKN